MSPERPGRKRVQMRLGRRSLMCDRVGTGQGWNMDQLLTRASRRGPREESATLSVVISSGESYIIHIILLCMAAAFTNQYSATASYVAKRR